MDIYIFSLLSLLTVHVYGGNLVHLPIELAPIPCDDKAVMKLSRLAVTYINEDRTEGYKFALNRITNVHLHAQGPAGNVYYLDLDVLETKCHTGSPKPWKRCDIRPLMDTQISGNCNTTILHTPEGFSYLYSYDCSLVPDSRKKLQQTCPTCPLLLHIDSPEAMAAAQITLASFKMQSTFGAGLGVKKITRVASQNVPVKAIFVEYTVQECPEGITERGTCQRLTLKSDTETVGFCTGSVQGDINNNPDVQLSCEMFKVQNVDVIQPVQPQGHKLPQIPVIPTLQTLPSDPGSTMQPAPSDLPLPTDDLPLPTDAQPVPFEPTAAPVPSNPPVAVNPSVPLTSSSSESDECLRSPKRHHLTTGSSDSSSEEVVAPMALRRPLNFRYQKRDRKIRQVLTEPSPSSSYDPIFLSNFPNGPSPFRSCPGPARYATV